MSRSAFVAAVLLAASVTAAVAEPAATRRSVALLDGPGNQFDALTVIPRRTQVEVFGCSRGWCGVELGGEEGFVFEQSLDFNGSRPPEVIFPPVVYQNGWGYWRQNHGEDWQRWREQYGRTMDQPYVTPQRRSTQPYVPPPVPALPPGGPTFGQPGAPPPSGPPQRDQRSTSCPRISPTLCPAGQHAVEGRDANGCATQPHCVAN